MKKTISIETKHLNVWYSSLQALKNVTVQIPQQKITALIGASGSGKSTFLRSLNRILENTPNVRISGTIHIGGEDIYAPQTDVTALRRKVGMVFQNPTPFPKSIYNNVAYGLEIQGQHRPKTLGEMIGIIKTNGTALEKSHHPVDQTVVSSLKQAALWEEVRDRIHQSAYRLSGGQQQRLCIARAIAVRPQVLLLDEPCSALDPISTKKIEELLFQLTKQYTIVIVTHNLHQARRISDYVGFFHLGELIEFGTTDHMFGDSQKELTRGYVQGHFG